MIVALFFLLLSSVQAGEFNHIKVKQLYIETDRAVINNQHWSIPKGEVKKGSLGLGLELSDYNEIYFIRSNVDSFYTDRQFRYISLIQEIALEPKKKGLEIFFRHQSEHGMDFEYQNTNGRFRFPDQNSIGIKFKFIDD